MITAYLRTLHNGPLCNLFGSGGSKSTTADNRKAVTDQGFITDGAGAASARDEANARATSATNATVGQDNAVTLANASNNNVGGLTISDAKGNVSITTSDPDIIKAALDSVTDLASKTNAAIGSITSGSNALLSELATVKATDGKSNTDKTVLLVALGALGLFAFTRGKN